MLRDMSALQIVLSVAGIGLLIAWHELGHYWVARWTGMRVLRYSLGFGPKLWGWKKDGIEYQIAALPFGGFVQIFGMTPFEEGAIFDERSFINSPRWARIATIAAGPGFNYALAIGLFFAYHAFVPQGAFTVDEVTPDSPAAQAGIAAGDIIDRAPGRVLTADQLTKNWTAESGVRIRRIRVNADQTLDVKRIELAALEGADSGIKVTYAPKDMGFVEAGGRAFSDTWRLSVRTLGALPALFSGLTNLFHKPDEVPGSGPVGIVRELKRAAKQGAGEFLWLLAYLSVTLGLLNLLPIPALDGMKIVFLSLGAVLRREVSHVVQVWVNAIGLLLLLGLIGLLTVNDIIVGLS
jgi:regulator of sigma E protease